MEKSIDLKKKVVIPMPWVPKPRLAVYYTDCVVIVQNPVWTTNTRLTLQTNKND